MERRGLAALTAGCAMGLSMALLGGCGTSGSSGISTGSISTNVKGSTNGLSGALRWAPPWLDPLRPVHLAPVAYANRGGDGAADGVTDAHIVPSSVKVAAFFCGMRNVDGSIFELFSSDVSDPAIVTLSNGTVADWMISSFAVPPGTYDAFVFDCLYIQQTIVVDILPQGFPDGANDSNGQFRLWLADGTSDSTQGRRKDAQIESSTTPGQFEWMDLGQDPPQRVATRPSNPYQNSDAPETRQVILFTTPIVVTGGPAEVVVTFRDNSFFFDDTVGSDGVFSPGRDGDNDPGTTADMEGMGLPTSSWYPVFPLADVTYTPISR